MRFLADESCDFAIVRALRRARHDVTAVAEIAPRAEDPAVIALARSEGRVLLTEDKDFGQLVFASGTPSPGVILFRFVAKDRESLLRITVDLVEKRGPQLSGRFVVVQPGRIRFGPVLQA